MKDKKQLITIAGVSLIIIIFIGGLITWAVVNNQSEKGNNLGDATTVTEKYVKKLADGTKMNTSSKMKEVKKIDGLEITIEQITSLNNSTTILGTIENKTDKTLGGYPVNIVLINDKGEPLTKISIGGYIDEVAPGEKKQLNASATLDLANAYNVKFEKIEVSE